jgi:hypothetical protein
VKLVVAPLLTVWAVVGLMLPPVPAEGVTAYVFATSTAKLAVTVQVDVTVPVV